MPLPLSLMLLAVLLPLGAFVLLVMLGRRMGTTLCGGVGTAATLGSFTCAIVTLMGWLGGGVWAGETWGAGRATLAYEVLWARGLSIGLYVDSLTVLLVACGLLASTAVHVFTTGYLRHDVRGPRIFALLALADASFVGLMTSVSPVQWMAWAMAGSLAAYLLALPVPLGPGGLGITPIPRGLTRDDLRQRATASLALLTLRLAGDGLLLLAIALWLRSGLQDPEFLAWWRLWAAAETVAFSPWAGWCLVGAAICHALAFPLSLFIPDAKGAPTPAAGLVYAVTLLPSGPLLLVRCFPLLSDAHLSALSIIGAVTLVASAVCALVELDLRRLLAWVAAAGIGAMLAAIGTGSASGAVLHTVACMFGVTLLLLASGSVLHTCQGEHRLWHYGGLLFRMPASALLLAHGAGTVLGGPVLAGSGSWRTLFTHAYRSAQAGDWRGVVTLLGLAAGLVLVAAALGRLWALLMLDTPRDRVVYNAARESATLTVPVAALAVVATVIGSAVLSPVDHLVYVLPREMTGVVAGRDGPIHPGRDRAEADEPLPPGWREIRPPMVTPPLPSDDPAEDPRPPPDEPPPDTKTPRAVDPARWMLAAFGGVLGLLLAGRGRGTPAQRHFGEALARGFYASRAAVWTATRFSDAVAEAVRVTDRLVWAASVDLLARIVLPIGRRPSRHVAASPQHRLARPLGSLLLLSLISLGIMFTVATWVLVTGLSEGSLR